MIRINLMPTKEGRKKKSGQRTVAIIGLLVGLEILGLFLWYQTVASEVDEAMAAANAQEQRVQRLEKAKKKVEDKQETKEKLNRQNVIFDKMKHEKSGPPEMLKFLSYILTKKEDNLYNREELKAQEAAGWASGWDTENLWITDLQEDQLEMTVKGLAKSHEDVAEFYRRLETGVYFVVVEPVLQKVTTDNDFKDLELIAFEAHTLLNYNPDGKVKLARGDVPESLLRMMPPPPAPEPSAKDGKKGKKGKGGH